MKSNHVFKLHSKGLIFWLLQVNFVIIAKILKMKLLYCHHIVEKVPTLSPVFSVQLLTPLGDILSSPHLAPLQFREYFVAN